MCFGDSKKTKEVVSNKTTSQNINSELKLPDWVTAAGQDNYNLARGIMDSGFEGYTGERVAPLSQNEQTATNLIANTAASGNPYEAEAEAMLRKYGNAPGYNFGFNTITDESGPLGSMAGYMNPHLAAVLEPALRQLGIMGTQQRQGINANATQAGAYGDARHGVVEGAQRKNELQTGTDLTAKTFSDAWMDAMSRRTTDAGRHFATQQAQAGEDAKVLDRSRTGAIDLTNLDKYGVSRDLGLASALGATGENQRKIEQAGLDANYQEFLREQGWSTDQVKLLTQVLAATPTGKTQTGVQSGTAYGNETTTQPDNSGWGILGSLAGAVLAPMTGGLSLGLGGLFGGSSGGSSNPNVPSAGVDTGGNTWGNFGFG